MVGDCTDCSGEMRSCIGFRGRSIAICDESPDSGGEDADATSFIL